MRHRLLAALCALASLLAVLPPTAGADMEPIPYTVARGDTATAIARRHGISLADLSRWNPGLNLDRLRAGARIVVGEGWAIDHEVLPRETVGGIAARHRVTRRQLALWNPDVHLDRLGAGTHLRIYSPQPPPSESVGRVDRGSLVNGVPLPEHPGYHVRNPERAWMTADAAERLARAFDAVVRAHPDAPRVEVRDASRPEGGRLDQHHSHQTGRDVDLAYYRDACRGALCALHWMTPGQLDADLQWALLSHWLDHDDVEYVFIDHSLQEPLRAAALRAGAPRARTSRWFQFPRPAEHRVGVVRHVPRHTNHLHVRFRCAPGDTRCLPSDGSDPEDAPDTDRPDA